MDALRMIEAPSGKSGSAFCTVNKTPFTLMVILPRGAYFATPALANTTSRVPFSRLICANRRSRSASPPRRRRDESSSGLDPQQETVEREPPRAEQQQRDGADEEQELQLPAPFAAEAFTQLRHF